MSRWLQMPAHASEAGDGRLPAGFRAAGVAAGIKASGDVDVGLLACSATECVSAARFTRSGVLAAPVIVTRERCRVDAIRAVAANSGNANAATGRQGLDEAARMQGAAATAAQVEVDRTAVASTGVIGEQLDGSKIVRGLLDASRSLADDGIASFADAIRTTAAFARRCELGVGLGGGVVGLWAQAKGAGMIQPAF